LLKSALAELSEDNLRKRIDPIAEKDGVQKKESGAGVKSLVHLDVVTKSGLASASYKTPIV
jgi:hypothetical protein